MPTLLHVSHWIPEILADLQPTKQGSNYPGSRCPLLGFRGLFLPRPHINLMNEKEKKTTRGVAILVIAALSHSFSGYEPSEAFDRAEAFVAEAENRGYDPISIAQGVTEVLA